MSAQHTCHTYPETRHDGHGCCAGRLEAIARCVASGTCASCGGAATAWTGHDAEWDYRHEGLCQGCWDREFRCGCLGGTAPDCGPGCAGQPHGLECRCEDCEEPVDTCVECGDPATDHVGEVSFCRPCYGGDPA